eukprot:gene27991-21117_t
MRRGGGLCAVPVPPSICPLPHPPRHRWVVLAPPRAVSPHSNTPLRLAASLDAVSDDPPVAQCPPAASAAG